MGKGNGNGGLRAENRKQKTEARGGLTILGRSFT
jgi:hypothetical protein